MAGFVAPQLPDPSDVRGTLRTLAQLEIEGAIRDGGVAMRLALDARSVPEVAQMLGEGPQANQRGLSDYLASRQASGDLRSDVAPKVMAEAFFALTSTLVMARQVLESGDSAREAGAPEFIDQLADLYWSAVKAPVSEEEAPHE
jgi:hypothetical protein